MQFKMIREAETINKLGDKAAFAQHVQRILGVDSVIPVVEAVEEEFSITPQHYTQWLETMIDMARENGTSLSKRAAFEDLAHEILDNDLVIDMLGGDTEVAKQNITNALWKAYQVSKAHDRVTKHVSGTIAQAREDEQLAAMVAGCEDEESTKSTIQQEIDNLVWAIKNETPRSTPGDHPATQYEQHAKKIAGYRERLRQLRKQLKSSEDEESGFEQAFTVAKGVENEEHGHAKRKTNPYPPHTLRAALWDEAHSKGSTEDEELFARAQSTDNGPEEPVDPDTMSADDLASHITGGMDGESDVESRVDDLEARVAELEGGDDPDSADMDMRGMDDSEDKQDDADPRALVVNKSFDDEERVKNIFRTAITAPKQHLSAALKDVEAEGSKAFTGLSMPQNPHPKKSQAYNAWEKGFKRTLKDTLGLGDKPREVTSKHRSTRRK